MAAKKKTKSFGSVFERALRTVVSVDKATLDKRIERDKAKRIKRRKKS